jgi:type I restriction-modification system DNA methylase subunit
MPNEKKTENLSRKLLARVGIFDNDNFIVEEQKSDNPIIQKLLKNASKSGTGLGKPEFIIRKKDDNDFLIVIECKAKTKYHESKNRDLYKDYAVDGALLYGSYLSKEFNVIAIGISGENEVDIKISTFLFIKKSPKYTDLLDENNKKIQTILTWERYIDRAKFDPILAKSRHSDLMRFSRELHDYMRDYAKVTEAQKPLLVSGILLALMDKGYEVAYKKYEGEELAAETFNSIKKIIEKAELGDTHETKKRAVINAFSFIEHHPELQKIDAKKNESPLLHIIQDLHVHVKPFTKDHYDFDIIGNFYGEFIRYTGGDGKGLGIVLTPKHITDLFAELAKLDKNSVVLDICAGTGGFLISAMKKMTDRVSAEEKRRILSNSLIGIEQEPQMFALAVSNMILRGDGKTNLYQGSCFDNDLFKSIQGKANAGFMNPPYSQKGDNLHEWDFIIRMLDGLNKNATGIAIVPMSVAIDTKHPLREKLLSEHRLEAVMSMPDDLFYPVGTVTCIMVFTAHTPHDSDKHHESWFGYWKNDGFRKDKKEGRIATNKWLEIKENWIAAFSSKKEIAGFGIRKKVTADDEWCAEAYLETDFSNLNELEFIQNTIKVASFLFKNGKSEMVEFLLKNKNSNKAIQSLNTGDWKSFSLGDLFNFEKGERLTKLDRIEGNMPLVTAGENNNGIAEYISFEEFKDKKKIFENKITVDMFFNVFYHDYKYFSDDNIHTLLPIGFDLDKYSSLFLVTVLSKLKYKYAYGRQVRLMRLPFEKIKLPVDKNGKPDWKFMENYIKSLSFASTF